MFIVIMLAEVWSLVEDAVVLEKVVWLFFETVVSKMLYLLTVIAGVEEVLVVYAVVGVFCYSGN